MGPAKNQHRGFGRTWGVLLLSLKFAYHLHTEAKVNHAQFWILATMEDRLLNVISELRALRTELRDSLPTGHEHSSANTSAKDARDSPQED